MLIRFFSTWLRTRQAARRDAKAGGAAGSHKSPDSARPRDSSPAGGPLQLYRAGLGEAALQAATLRLASHPNDAEAQLVQGLAALDGGNAAEALRKLETAIKGAPTDARLMTACGRAYLAVGRHAAAEGAFERALQLAPNSAEPRLHMARMALQAGQHAKAKQLLQVAVEYEPALADAQLLLGNVFLALGDAGAAGRHYRLALAADDLLADAHANLGAVLKDSGDFDGAALHLERALQLKPELAPASFNLAMVRLNQNQWEDVAMLLHASLRHDPKQADAWYWLGNALMRQGDAGAARDAYSSALGLDRKFVRARWGLAMAQLPAVPKTDDEQRAGVQNFAREFKKLHNWVNMHRPADAYQAVGAQQPYYLAYVPQNHRAALREYGLLSTQLMASWAGGAGLAAPMVGRGAKRKIGIVCAHICSHSVWHAIVRGWVEHLDAGSFELHLLHTGHQVDAETQWAARRVRRLHHGLGDWTAWAKAISSERFDVLVYPEIGMDSTTMRLSALRLAPMQLAGWGHPITTGLPTMDGFVSAQAFEPAGAEEHYTEHLFALPRLGCCYQPFGTQPAPVNLAAWGIHTGESVLVCAGTPFKYAPANDVLLVEIARRCAPCKLVFFRAAPVALADLLEQRLRRAFAVAGADFDASVRFIPWQSQAAFFGLLDQAQVVLDSIGFSGFNTAMQAVERAVPIVAWEGAFLRGRFASGILQSMGMGELVADTADAYVEKVAQLCSEQALRERVRSQLAERKASLFNDLDSVASFGSLLLKST